MYNVTMYTYGEMSRVKNHGVDEYFEFEIDVDGMTFNGSATYGEIGTAHEDSRNVLVLLDSNDVLFIDVCEVDELSDRMFEWDAEEDIMEDFELDDIVEELLED